MEQLPVDLSSPYAITDFEKQVSAMKPRFVDIWVIPPLVMYSAWKAKSLGRWTRRILFTAGIYMMYRNYAEYKSSLSMLTSVISPQKSQESGAGSTAVIA